MNIFGAVKHLYQRQIDLFGKDDELFNSFFLSAKIFHYSEISKTRMMAIRVS